LETLIDIDGIESLGYMGMIDKMGGFAKKRGWLWVFSRKIFTIKEKQWMK
jgi:hypothetical protein